VVNIGSNRRRAKIQMKGCGALDQQADVWTLTGELRAINGPESPERVVSKSTRFNGVAEHFSYDFPARSYTIMRLHKR
jgi:alpha-L-arabinofuranosidase